MGKHPCELRSHPRVWSISPPEQNGHAQSTSQQQSLRVFALNNAPEMPGTGLDRTGQKPLQGAREELNDSCKWESVPRYCFIYYSRRSCSLLLLCVAVKLPSHPKGGHLKPWGYLHGFCGSGARCTGGKLRPAHGQGPVCHPEPSACPLRWAVQSRPHCVALCCVPCPPVLTSCQDC